MEIKGRIISVLSERSGISQRTGNPWKIAQYVLETAESYPKHMVFEVFGEDRIKTMNIQEGEDLTVSFDLDASEYQGKWYNNIRAWKVERIGQPGTIQSEDPFPPMNEMPEEDITPF